MIRNVNGFYSPHYFDSLLQRDLHDFAAHHTLGPQPWRRLASCTSAYFDARTHALQESSNPSPHTADNRHADANPHADATPHAGPHPTLDLHSRLAEALGYTPNPHTVFLDDGTEIPTLARLQRDGQDWLWILETPLDTERDPLDRPLWRRDGDVRESTASRDAAAHAFRRELPPRWILLLAGDRILLLQRDKFGRGQYLDVDLEALFGARDTPQLRATFTLLCQPALAPDAEATGGLLHDTLDENAHRHAFAVSTDLKHGVLSSVELLANEAVHYLRHDKRERVLSLDDSFARELTGECLTWLYRLLFLFYAEARGRQLGVLPTDAEAYRLGYSLEHLRDLELRPLQSEHARNGFFLHESLDRLFALVNDGYAPDATTGMDARTSDPAPTPLNHHGFALPGLHSPLFDTASTPTLSRCRFRNHVLQRILQHLSLSRPGRKSRGRISYAELGINQLGAVYEGLLSFSGFFAHEDLWEVKPAAAPDDDPDRQRYFVPERELHQYTDDELVHDTVDDAFDDASRAPRIYRKGQFVFRLAGRDREKSASFYTPEVLTRCLVKYALRERLDGLSANDILELTLLEPAMGSGAFLNEAVNQLADAYLERAQHESGQRIPPEDFPRIQQRTREYIATHQAFGVDLNPTALELARISLWLNVLHRHTACPFFGFQLACGNSLVGARLATVPAPERFAEPATPLRPGTDLPDGHVLQFLLPTPEMGEHARGKTPKSLRPQAHDDTTAWRKHFAHKRFDDTERRALHTLSRAALDLWERHTRALRTAREDANGVARPLEGVDTTPELHVRDKERLLHTTRAPTSACARLKAVLDAWSALWFWPLEHTALLPSRREHLHLCAVLLLGSEQAAELGLLEESAPQTDLFDDAGSHTPLVGRASREQLDLVMRFGFVDVDALVARGNALLEEHAHTLREGSWDLRGPLSPTHRWLMTLAVAQQVAEQRRFLHWELEFPTVFADRGGFDLIIGNPPWLKVQWEEAGLLSEFEPTLGIRKTSASEVAKVRDAVLAHDPTGDRLRAFAGEYVEFAGLKNFLGSGTMYPLLKGVQTNLYKNFITLSWSLGNADGVSALIHQEGVFGDAKGRALLRGIYERALWRFEFRNKMLLFAEVEDQKTYGLLITQTAPRETLDFRMLCNLFHPSTIDACLVHDGTGGTPGIRDADGWILRGHRNRIIRVDEDRLAVFAELFDEPGTDPREARLPVLHSEELATAVAKLGRGHRRLGELEDAYFATVMFDETYAQRDGTIRAETVQPETPAELVLSGPHFFVGTPLNKTPNEGCRNNLDYSDIDLTAIPDDYLPRTNYVPGVDRAEYRRRAPSFGGRSVLDYYRQVQREYVPLTGERTFVPALLPPGAAHVHAVFGLAFTDPRHLATFHALSCSLPYDFLLRASGNPHINQTTTARLPFPDLDATAPDLARAMRLRALRLNCLTTHYADLWAECWDPAFVADEWATDDPRVPSNALLTAEWTRDTALRTDYARRWALVELDVLAARALGLTLEELLTVYRVNFHVLQDYEATTLYDQTGRIAFRKRHTLTNSDARTEWESRLAAASGDVSKADVSPIRSTVEGREDVVYRPPLETVDREGDYGRVWGWWEGR